MAKSTYIAAIANRTLKLSLSVNEAHFHRTDAAFRRFANQQRPSVRRKLLAVSTACRRLESAQRSRLRTRLLAA